jgi:hypothetical protein
VSWFSKATSWVGNAVKSVASVALPIAGFAVGLVSPTIGNAITKVADKIGGAVANITGIGDGKPGILGIGDGQPGILGIGTGKAKEEQAKEIAAMAVEQMQPLLAKLQTSQGLTEPEKVQLAKLQADADMKSEGMGGIIPWLIGLLGFAILA